MSCFCIGPQCFSLSAVSNSERKLLDNAMSPRAMYGANRQETASRFEALRLYLPTDTSWAACRTQNGPMSIVNLIAFVRWISSGGWFGYHTLHSSPQPQIADSISNYVPNVCLWPNRKCTNWMQKKKIDMFHTFGRHVRREFNSTATIFFSLVCFCIIPAFRCLSNRVGDVGDIQMVEEFYLSSPTLQTLSISISHSYYIAFRYFSLLTNQRTCSNVHGTVVCHSPFILNGIGIKYVKK